MLKILSKYGLVTFINYLFIIFGTYLLVDKIGISANISYFIIISIVYIGTYIAYTKFVFESDSTKKVIIKFVIALVVFWFLNNIFYNIFLEVFNIQYLIAAVLNIIILGTIRFFVYKNLVFKKTA